MEMLKTAARAGLKLLKWLLIVLLVLIGAVFAINAVDEKLQPEAAAALRWPESGVDNNKNGYFALVGLSAPAGQNATAWGQRWVEAMNQARGRAEVETVEKALAATPLKFAGAPTSLCDFRAEQACAPAAAKHADTLAKLTIDNAELLARYAALGGFAQFADVYRPQSVAHPLIGLAIYSQAQKLVLSRGLAELDRDAGRPTLRIIADDIGLQRRILAGAGSLILKMAANNALARDYLALAELIKRQPALAAAEAVTLQGVLAPLNKQELALRPAMLAEFRTMAGVLDDPAIADPGSYQLMQILGAAAPSTEPLAPSLLKASVLDAVLAPLMKGAVAVLLQKNATRNRQFEALNGVAALDDIAGPELAAAEQALHGHQDPGVGINWLYNPIGKLILSIAIPNFSDYKRRLVDVDGLRRLLALQVGIAAGPIADADIPAFLAKSERALADPYTNQAMRWDAEKRALVFTTAKNSRWFVVGKDGRIAVSL